MPEAEGYMGIINLLNSALELMDDGDAKELVTRARNETVKQARQSASSLQMGMDLGKLLAQDEHHDSADI